MKAFLIALLLAASLPAYAKTPEIIPLSPGYYLIERHSYAGAFASMGKMKIKVLKQANKFAASKGKVQIPVSERTSRPQPGWPTYEYQFKLVDPDSEEAKAGSPLVSAPDHINEQRNKYSGGITITQDTTKDEPDDLYGALLKLDMLREKGIITQEEFNTQKERILK